MRRYTHIVIPDTQLSPTHSTSFMWSLGRYVGHRKPDVIVHLGDLGDFPSLSSWDKGKKAFEGRRYKADVAAINDGVDKFERGMRKEAGPKYRPRKVLVCGNHENRIERAVEEDAKLEGVISFEKDIYLPNWEVYPFLEVVEIHGISYSHFFPRGANGQVNQQKNGAPSARVQLLREGGSCTAGHQQGLDVSCYPLKGRLQWGIIAGSAYPWDEGYKSPQGNKHWRGLIVKQQVSRGEFYPMFPTLESIVSEFK